MLQIFLEISQNGKLLDLIFTQRIWLELLNQAESTIKVIAIIDKSLENYLSMLRFKVSNQLLRNIPVDLRQHKNDWMRLNHINLPT